MREMGGCDLRGTVAGQRSIKNRTSLRHTSKLLRETERAAAAAATEAGHHVD